jgi:hypothetical protein
MERIGDIGKNGGILFDRPKPTADCSASGEEKRKEFYFRVLKMYILLTLVAQKGAGRD